MCAKTSWKKNSRWFYWMDVTDVAMYASSMQKVGTIRLCVRCLSSKSFPETVRPLEWPIQSRWCKWRTILRWLCTWTAYFCSKWKGFWATQKRSSRDTVFHLQRPVSKLVLTILIGRDMWPANCSRSTSGKWGSATWWRRLPMCCNCWSRRMTVGKTVTSWSFRIWTTRYGMLLGAILWLCWYKWSTLTFTTI